MLRARPDIRRPVRASRSGARGDRAARRHRSLGHGPTQLVPRRRGRPARGAAQARSDRRGGPRAPPTLRPRRAARGSGFLGSLNAERRRPWLVHLHHADGYRFRERTTGDENRCGRSRARPGRAGQRRLVPRHLLPGGNRACAFDRDAGRSRVLQPGGHDEDMRSLTRPLDQPGFRVGPDARGDRHRPDHERRVRDDRPARARRLVDELSVASATSPSGSPRPAPDLKSVSS